jgi:flagellar biosynthesis protein FliR
LPPGALAASHDIQIFTVALPQTLLRAAFFVAGPAIAIALVAQIALAIVARLVPRFSTFTLSFPIVFACVLVATVAALPLALHAAASPWMDLSMLRVRK